MDKDTMGHNGEMDSVSRAFVAFRGEFPLNPHCGPRQDTAKPHHMVLIKK